MSLLPGTRQILSLCDYSGSWSQPYVDAGYQVTRVDLAHGQDVRLLKWPGEVWGILAAPPCRVFCRPGARLWEEWGEEGLLEGLSILDACLRLVTMCRPRWWVLENPPGRITDYLGPPAHSFQPHHYGDPYTKQTYLWGKFTVPEPAPCIPTPPPAHLPVGSNDRTSRLSSGDRRRSETPAGFAQAFFKANP